MVDDVGKRTEAIPATGADRATAPVGRGRDPVAAAGFDRTTPVSVPLDFLQSLAAMNAQSVQRQPPRMRLRRPGSLDAADELSALVLARPVANKETAELAYVVAEMIVRRKAEVEGSGNLGARRGMAALEKMCRMFEHIYVAQTGGVREYVRPPDGFGEDAPRTGGDEGGRR